MLKHVLGSVVDGSYGEREAGCALFDDGGGYSHHTSMHRAGDIAAA